MFALRARPKQAPGGVTRGVLEVVIDDLPTTWPEARPGSPKFLTAFLPIDDPRHLPPLPVGNTPLLRGAPTAQRARHAPAVAQGRHPQPVGLDQGPRLATRRRQGARVRRRHHRSGLDRQRGHRPRRGRRVGRFAGGGFCPGRRAARQVDPDAELWRRGPAGCGLLRRRLRALARRLRAVRLDQPQHRFQPIHHRGQKDRRPRDRRRHGAGGARRRCRDRWRRGHHRRARQGLCRSRDRGPHRAPSTPHRGSAGRNRRHRHRAAQRCG